MIHLKLNIETSVEEELSASGELDLEPQRAISLPHTFPLHDPTLL